MIRKNAFIAFNIALFIVLIFAWSERWSYSPKITSSNDGMMALYKKDNWTGEIWITTYTNDSDNFGQPAYGRDETSSGKATDKFIRNTLTFIWFILMFLSLFFSINGL